MDFIMKYEKITKHEAILEARDLLGYYPKPTIPDNKPGPKELPELSPEDHQRILTESFTHFVILTPNINVTTRQEKMIPPF